MIGDVEKFSAELCVELLANLHVLQEREIEITISRPNDDVSSGGTEGLARNARPLLKNSKRLLPSRSID